MKGEIVLYPCYFNGALTRRGGRRIAARIAPKNPTLTDLEHALRKSKITFRSEAKHHPAHWWKHEGRVVVTWGGRKEALLRQVATQFEMKREVKR
jgi:signal recognition particle subunit SRP19